MISELLNKLKGEVVEIEANKPSVLISALENGNLETSQLNAQHMYMGTLVGWDDKFLYINVNDETEVTEDTKGILLNNILYISKSNPEAEQLDMIMSETPDGEYLN